MRTVKQVSELTGISVRTLHYYDEIGLLKPSEVTESGYRLYDDDALEALQQILFFRELDFSLKDIKSIMLNPKYDKNKAFENQRKMIQEKRDRLNGLLNLLDKLIKGERCMSFKEFDMSEYTKALEEFINNNSDQIIEYGGDLDVFNKIVETLKSDKSKEEEAAKLAIRQFGSIENYTESMKKNFNNFPEVMKQLNVMKDSVDGYVNKTNELIKKLTSDLSKDTSSKEVQQTLDEWVKACNEYTKNIDMGEGYWELVAEGYLSNPSIIEVTDKKYGTGASAFIGEALKTYWDL